VSINRREMLLKSAALTASGWLATGMARADGNAAGGNDEPSGPIPTPEPRVARFERLAYGMFIHWGLYSQLGRGEWVMNREKIPVEEYEKLTKTFTAKAFDGRKIAQTAKRAGMKYITLTSRHHDGFSLYDTRGLTTYDAPHSAAGRDLIADFVEGCRAEGIVPMLYHTTLDWHHPQFNGDFNAYLDYLHGSVEVLCTHYGELGGLWFDGNWSKKDADWKEDRLYGMIRRLQPEAMIINNTGLHQRGKLGHPEIDSTTFEQGRPTPMDRRGVPKYVSAEMCQTMNRHWGYGKNDFCYKSPKEIIENLAACRKVGANYLLNVGPDAEGRIPEYEAAALGRSGDWVRMHEEVIYDGKPMAVECKGHDFALATDKAVYLFIHDLGSRGDANVTLDISGAGPRTFKGIDRKVTKAEWIDNDEQLKIERKDDALTVHCTGFPYGTHTVVRVVRLT
jgi:alpha-L-fucosidase